MTEFLSKFVKAFFDEFGLIEWLLFWAFLLITPFFWFGEAFRQFRKRDRNRKKTQESAIRNVIKGVAFLGCVALLLVFFGRPLITMTIEGVGSWFIGFLIAVATCLVAFPICLAGAQLRQAYEYTKGNHPAPLRNKALTTGTIDIIAIAGIALSLYLFDGRIALVFGVVALLAIVVGWFGNILVPEV
jgi:hypothetical protein